MKWPNDFINKIIYSDCLDIFPLIPNNSIDLILTDIPYNETNQFIESGLRKINNKYADELTFELIDLLNELNRICHGSIYIFCGFGQISVIHNFFKKNKMTNRILIWIKNNPSPMNAKSVYLCSHELIFWSKNNNAVFNSFYNKGIFNFNKGKNEYSPTQKPLELIKEFIKISSNKNDIVFDPFCGSGTTAIACNHLNRKFIVIEKNKKQYEIALKRFELEKIKENKNGKKFRII